MGVMSVYDEVVCNHPIFGDNRGEVYQTHSLGPVFPGASYEITSWGRPELLECTYEDRSDRNADGWARLAGAMTPVYTGKRRDLNYHGWLDLSPLGRAKFTDGQLIPLEAWSGERTQRSSIPESIYAWQGSKVIRAVPTQKRTACRHGHTHWQAGWSLHRRELAPLKPEYRPSTCAEHFEVPLQKGCRFWLTQDQ